MLLEILLEVLIYKIKKRTKAKNKITIKKSLIFIFNITFKK